MHSLALVATAYGVAQRRLGMVSLIGPVRMDYAGAIATVREAAHELSRFVEDTYSSS
jgi:heat-inducible transcriptional repressor